MTNKKMISWALIAVAIIIGLIIFRSAIPFICFCIQMIGWVMAIGIIVCLTGLQSKISKALGGSAVGTAKTIKIPFLGKAEFSAISGQEVVLKFKKQRK